MAARSDSARRGFHTLIHQLPRNQSFAILTRIPSGPLAVSRSCLNYPNRGSSTRTWWERTMADGKIRVGIVGASASRGFASIAHIPALRALPQFEIIAVCTASQQSAEASARHYGVPLAFSEPAKLARHPDVDLVTVSVKVPDHYRPVIAAIEAGKHVYCEWPLGRNTDEARTMLDAAESRGI